MRITLFFLIGFLSSDLLSVAAQNEEMKCSVSNDRCSLPFTFGGRNYDACTTDGIDDGRSWCPTEVYENGTADVHYCMECWANQLCYYKANSFPDRSWTLSCPKGCYYAQKRVYGTDNEFSEDSYICAAAIHEGLITSEEGGIVNFEKSPMQGSFLGEDKNNIKTYPANKEGAQKISFTENFKPKVFPLMTLATDSVIATINSESSTEISNVLESGARSIDCDARKKTIYWIDSAQTKIMRADYDPQGLKNEQEIIGSNQLRKPEFLAYDWMKEELYWTDSGDHSVSKSDKNGKGVQNLIRRGGAYAPKGIALDVKNGNYYVADAGSIPKIERCSMKTRGDCRAIVGHDIISPAGIALDPNMRTFCWADAKIPSISCADLDGRNIRKMVHSDERLKQPFSIKIFQQVVYWTDISATIVGSASLETWNDFCILIGDLKAYGLLFCEEAAQIVFEPSKSNTVDVYVADITTIQKLSINASTRALLNSKSIVAQLTRATAVAVDVTKNEIYWTDSEEKSIYKKKISDSGNSKENVITVADGFISKPEGIAIDSANRLLYWSDVGLNTVFVANLEKKNNERHIAVIVKGRDDFKPRGIALNTDDGHIYITDSAEPYHVLQCEIESRSICKTIVSSYPNELNWIAVDESQRRVYVTSSVGIFNDNFVGNGRRDIELPAITDYRPFGIGLNKEEIFFSDRESKSVIRLRNDGRGITTIKENFVDPLGIFIHDLTRKYDADSSCRNHQCRYLCVPRGRGRHTCRCSERNLGSSDALECEITPPCLDNPCLNGGRCVEDQNKIDFTCECRVGFKGMKCEDLNPQLIVTTHPITQSIHMECRVPDGVVSQIIWNLNRERIDQHTNGMILLGRNLDIIKPHYTQSGVYTCEFVYNGDQAEARALVKIDGDEEHMCGQAPGRKEPIREAGAGKIFGGTITKAGFAPWTAMLYNNIPRMNIPEGVFCGGSLVTTRHVISAAHCFQTIPFPHVTVYVGKHQARGDMVEPAQQSSEIEKVINHPSYVPKTFHSDINIIVLKTELYYSAAVKPICIASPTSKAEDITPRTKSNKKPKYGYVFGWGLTETGRGSKQLREVDIPILTSKKCKKLYAPRVITSQMFCAGENSKDSCRGDSGGPFALWSDNKNAWFLGGIVSWGDLDCAKSGKPGVYTKLGVGIRKWIFDTTGLKY